MRSVYLCNSVGDDWPQFCKVLPFVAGAGVSSGSGYQLGADDITRVKNILRRVPNDTSALELMLHVCEVVREDLFDAEGLADAWPLTTPSTALAKNWHHSISDNHGGKVLRIAAAPYIGALSSFLANDERRALVEACSASLLARRRAAAAAAAADADVLSATASLAFLQLSSVARLVAAHSAGFVLVTLLP
jgi:hypothetical protein